MTVSNGLMQHTVRQPALAPEELHFWTRYSRIHCSFHRAAATPHSKVSCPCGNKLYTVCHSLRAPHSQFVLLLWIRTTQGSRAYVKTRLNGRQYKRNSSDFFRCLASKQNLYRDCIFVRICALCVTTASALSLRVNLSLFWYENKKLLRQLEACTVHHFAPLMLCCWSRWIFVSFYLPWGFQSS